MAFREWLRRRLGTWDIYALVHHDSQSTFYLMAGFILLAAGQYGLFVMLYSAALLIAVALAYGEMGSRFPETGGSYLHVKIGLGNLGAFTAVWLLAIDQIIMVGYGTLDASRYILAYSGLAIPPQALAIALSTALYILALVGIKESSRVGLAVFTAEAAVMTALLAAVFTKFGAPPPYFSWRGVEPQNLLYAFSLASRGYTGIDAIGQLAGEATAPLIQIPRAAAIAAAVGTTYGLLLSSAIMSALTPAEIKDPALVMLQLAQKAAPPMETPVFAVIVMIMLMAALTGYVSFARLIYILADEKLLPPHFAKLHRRFRTPYVGLTFTYVVSILFLLPGEIELLVDIYAVGSLINYLMIALSLGLVTKRGILHSAFRSPRIRGFPTTSIAAIALTATGIAFTAIEKLPYLWFLALWLAFGYLLYAATRKR